MRRPYQITWICSECGEEHSLTSGLSRDDGPTEPGALAQRRGLPVLSPALVIYP